jgi:hypothetical protein
MKMLNRCTTLSFKSIVRNFSNVAKKYVEVSAESAAIGAGDGVKDKGSRT